MDFLIALDHAHLDEPVFLKSLANTLGKLKGKKGIIVHSDSAYTDRIIQTGVMREEARRRAIKDLNNRLIALLADNGVAAVGLNAYQQDIVTRNQSGWNIKADYLQSFPEGVQLVLSTLIAEKEMDHPQPAGLSELLEQLAPALGTSQVITFTKLDAEEVFAQNASDLPIYTSETGQNSELLNRHLPEELKSLSIPLVVTSSGSLGELFS